MASARVEHLLLHDQQKLKDGMSSRGSKSEQPIITNSPSSLHLSLEEGRKLDQTALPEKLDSAENTSEERDKLEKLFEGGMKLDDEMTKDITDTISEGGMKLQQPLLSAKQDIKDNTCELQQIEQSSTKETGLGVTSKKDGNDCNKTRRKRKTGILCSKSDASKIVDEYFTSFLQPPKLYPYDDDEFQTTVERIPPNTVLYIIVNKSFSKVLQTDPTVTKRILNNMLSSKTELYFINFLDDEDDYMEVHYNLPRILRKRWVDKEDFITLSDSEDNSEESNKPDKSNKPEESNKPDETNKPQETNNNVQVGNNNTMEIKTETGNVTTTQIGGNNLFTYKKESSLEGIMLTIKTPESNHKLDVTIKEHIDDNLHHINVELQEIHAQVTSTELGSVIIRVTVEEGTKLGAVWLEKLIRTILSENILSSLPVGTKMEVNIQASLSLKPLNVGIFETTVEEDECASLLNEVSILFSSCKSSFTHIVAARGSTNLMDKLMKSGIDVIKKNHLHETPLHMAAKAGNVGVVKLLLKTGADITMKDDRHRTPLHIAAMKGKTECIEELMKFSRSIDTETIEITDPDCNKAAPYQIAQGLLAAGADINATDHDSNTPLHIAALTGDLDMLDLLLQYNPDARSLDSQGQTALHLAVANGHIKWGVRLTEYDQGALHITDKEGNTPLHGIGLRWTSWRPNKLPPPREDTAETPLQYAIVHGNIEAVYTLMKQGADVNEQDANGCSPLHYSLRDQVSSLRRYFHFDFEYARKFIQLYKREEINATNKNGNTPLHVALIMRRKAMISELLKAGADVHVVNGLGISPSDMMNRVYHQDHKPGNEEAGNSKGLSLSRAAEMGEHLQRLTDSRICHEGSKQGIDKPWKYDAFSDLSTRSLSFPVPYAAYTSMPVKSSFKSDGVNHNEIDKRLLKNWSWGQVGEKKEK